MSWDDVVAALKNDGPDLPGRINKYVAESEYENPGRALPAIDGWHPSSLSGFCARRHGIEKVFGIEGWNPDIELKKIFNVGTMYHEWYQNRYFGPMGILKGIWQCSRCGYWEWGFMPENQCQSCDWETDDDIDPADGFFRHRNPDPLIDSQWFGYWKYCEPWVYEPELGITGHMDGIIVIDGAEFLLEIKTINVTAYRKLEMPHDNYKVQQSIYQVLAKTNPFIDHEIEQGIILYITKDRAWGKPLEKEFVTQVDRPSVVPLLSEVGKANKFLAEIEKLDRALEMEDLPPADVCASQEKGSQRGCERVKECWLAG